MAETSASSEQQKTAPQSPNYTLTEGPFSLTPAHFLAGASLPLCIGTYVGFKRQLKIVEKEARAAHLKEEISLKVTRESKSVARRALGLGTLVSIGGFGLFGAVAFYASGFQSWEEAVSYLHEWGPRKRSQLEHFLGIDVKRNDSNPDVQATRNMTGDEEIEYYRKRYFQDNDDEQNGQQQQRDGVGTD